ncbi:MAG: serine hydrolase, partial [Candidatus Eisenbacteria bacterium]|nr:serine hydrolase [Candidatus Eisenbacteria bacterium]
MPLLYDFLSHYTLTRGVGERYEYSNLGMGLLGHALALEAKQSYEALLIERVLDPLGMKETRITLTHDLETRLAPGHDLAGKPVPNWDLPTLAGAGALRSTAADLLRFVAANLDSNGTALAADLFATHARRNDTTSPHVAIGLAWHIIERPEGNIWMHNGGTGGYHTLIAFDPRRDVGVVVLGNSAATVDDIGFHLLAADAPLEPVAQHAEVKIDPRLFDRYVGRYVFTPAFAIDVTREGDALFLQATGQPRLPVFPESDTRFFLKAV